MFTEWCNDSILQNEFEIWHIFSVWNIYNYDIKGTGNIDVSLHNKNWKGPPLQRSQSPGSWTNSNVFCCFNWWKLKFYPCSYPASIILGSMSIESFNFKNGSQLSKFCKSWVSSSFLMHKRHYITTLASHVELNSCRHLHNNNNKERWMYSGRKFPAKQGMK